MAHFRIGENLYDLNPRELSVGDLKAIKAELGYGAGQMFAAVGEQDPDAIQTLIWLFRRRTEPDLARNDVEFTLGDFIDGVVNTDEDVSEEWLLLGPQARTELVDGLPADQRERLFTEKGFLKETDEVPFGPLARLRDPEDLLADYAVEMAHLFGIRPWEWDQFQSYGQMLDFCGSIEKRRKEMTGGEDDGDFD